MTLNDPYALSFKIRASFRQPIAKMRHHAVSLRQLDFLNDGITRLIRQ